jgi:hypothetical protein
MKATKLLSILVIAGLIASCSSTQNVDSQDGSQVENAPENVEALPPVEYIEQEELTLDDYKENRKVLRHLIHTSRDVQRQWGAINQLTELRTGITAPVLELTRTDPSLKRVFSFPSGYQGTLDKLVKTIAQTSGYDFLPSLGKKPIRGVDVIFVEEMRSLAEYLFDGGVQAGNRADVVIDMQEQTLQIVYTGF